MEVNVPESEVIMSQAPLLAWPGGMSPRSTTRLALESGESLTREPRSCATISKILLVLHDFGLLRIDHHAAGRPVAHVLHNDAEGEWNRAFHLRGERVVAHDIARLEVGDLKLSVRLHGDRGGEDLESGGRNFYAAQFAA